jgi:flagellar export protein FliJ
MAAFRFRLGSVLRHRERKREDRRVELRAIEQAKNNLIAEIDGFERSFAGQRREMEGQEGKVLSIAELKLGADFSQRLLERIRERRAALVAVEQRAAAKREELLQADREVKSLEQLRGKLKERHRLEEDREEQKLLDEVGQRRTLGVERGKKLPHGE